MSEVSRRRFCISLVGAAAGSTFIAPTLATPGAFCIWPAWETYKSLFIQSDGRVFDSSANGHSTSEGQVYALFFALIADDRTSFRKILNWAKDNLAGGNLASRLMAWQWGKRPDGTWGIIDGNAASDADLWLAYLLFQAGRLWRDESLVSLANQTANRIGRELIITHPKLGTILLPGATGFKLSHDRYKLNPSYQPLFLLRGLAKEQPKGPWSALAKSTIRMLTQASPKGLVPDWVLADPANGFTANNETGCQGSYDAIRVYLWAGLTSSQDSERKALMTALSPYVNLLEKLLVPPERVNTCSGKIESTQSPPGFSVALLPFLMEIGAKSNFDRLQERLTLLGGLPPVYYERSLGLFSEGWLEKRFRFEFDGRLIIGNQTLCVN